MDNISSKIKEVEKLEVGEKIAIITDAHALLEPLEAVMMDIKQRGIEKIFSLGDNIGEGLIHLK